MNRTALWASYYRLDHHTTSVELLKARQGYIISLASLFLEPIRLQHLMADLQKRQSLAHQTKTFSRVQSGPNIHHQHRSSAKHSRSSR